MGLFSSKKSQPTINWVPLKEESQLDKLDKESFERPVMFFKHSTRCSISTMALYRLENKWSITDDSVVPVFLDLLKYRAISDKLASNYEVTHQSPQIIIIKNGVCISTTSHSEIDFNQIKKSL